MQFNIHILLLTQKGLSTREVWNKIVSNRKRGFNKKPDTGMQCKKGRLMVMPALEADVVRKGEVTRLDSDRSDEDVNQSWEGIFAWADRMKERAGFTKEDTRRIVAEVRKGGPWK